jgi:hydrogenase maturation factor
VSPLLPPTASAAAGHCITCSDDAEPMTVVRIDEHRGLALCADAAGARHTVEIALVEPIATGEQVLVHAGVAIASPAGQGDATRGMPGPRQPAAEVQA